MKLHWKPLSQLRTATRLLLRTGPTGQWLRAARNNAMASQPAAWPGTFLDGQFSNASGQRSYKLYIPASHRGDHAALLVMLHGCTQDPVDFAVGTGMNQLAEETGMVVLYPAQSEQANPARCWNWFLESNQKGDVGEAAILAGMTRQILREQRCDPRHVYVAGLSAGGAMAAVLGSRYPELYAAVGVHSGVPAFVAHDLPSALAAMQGEWDAAQFAALPQPVIVFHGDQDRTVHPANGAALVAPHTHKKGLAPTSHDKRLANGLRYTCTIYPEHNGAVDAEYWQIHGGGHAWFGGNARGSYTDPRGPDASREMLRFFRTRR